MLSEKYPITGQTSWLLSPILYDRPPKCMYTPTCQKCQSDTTEYNRRQNERKKHLGQYYQIINNVQYTF